MTQKLARTALAALVLLALAALPAPAQDVPGGAVIRSRVNVVNLFVTAASGKTYVRDLTRDDFAIYENGVRQEIKYFNNLSQSRDLPLTVALLIDTSGSVADKLPQEIATASAFFRHIVRPGKDMITVMEFHSDVILVQDFTDDIDRMEKALGKLRPGGNTSLYDAVYLASEEKLKGEAGRKIIVILSDGEDTASKTGMDEAIKVAQKNDVLIYGLGIRSMNYGSDFRALERFCKETGGLFFSPKASFESLKKTFDAIMEDINHQYNIAYEPKNQTRDGSYREIKVTCLRKGLKLQYRQGYFAPED
jgi:VWFA-related protein